MPDENCCVLNRWYESSAICLDKEARNSCAIDDDALNFTVKTSIIVWQVTVEYFLQLPVLLNQLCNEEFRSNKAITLPLIKRCARESDASAAITHANVEEKNNFANYTNRPARPMTFKGNPSSIKYIMASFGKGRLRRNCSLKFNDS